MSDTKTNNVAPFDWNSLSTKIVGVLLVGLAVWVWTTNERVTKLEETDQRINALEKSKGQFWKLHSSAKEYINDLVDNLEDKVPDFDVDRFKWPDLDSD